MKVFIAKLAKRRKANLSLPVLVISAFTAFLILTTPASVSSAPLPAGTPPYPPSPLIDRIDWDMSNLVRLAPGSDLWPVTWGPDDNIYTSWGDGGGFNGTNSNGRVSLGFAKIEGSPTNFTATNIWGGMNGQNSAQFSGKTASIISVDGVLYSWINTQNRSSGPDYRLAWSNDLGARWQQSSWTMNSGSFALATFLNFGKDNSGARDNFVYSYGGKWGKSSDVFLARVPKNELTNLNSYEYLSGFDGSGNPQWSSNASNRSPVFSNSDSKAFNPSLLAPAVYNSGLSRYLLTIPYGDAGEWGVFDASEPWGPWTTVDYYDNWSGLSLFPSEALAYGFSNKWTSSNGLESWMFFSGVGGALDSFNLVKGTFITTPNDETPPAIESVSAGPSEVSIVFTEPVDPPTARDTSNYSINNGISVLSASMNGNDTVVLGTTAHESGVTYTVTVDGVEDLSGNAIVNKQISYAMSELPMVSNVRVANDGTSYEVVQNVDAGDAVYIDRGYVFTNIPSEVLGATYIRTANNDKSSNQNGGFLSFEVDRDVRVYLAYDARALSLPNWMSGWLEYDEVLGTSDTTRKLYFREYGLGEISLGGNAAAGAAGVGSNYSVFVTGTEGTSTNEPPNASFTSTPLTGEAPLTVNLDASGSSDSDGSIVSYAWTFGDGQSGNGSTVSHNYNEAGTFNVRLTVTDDDGDSDTAQKTIVVEEPVVEQGVSLTVQSGDVVIGNSVEIPIILDQVPIEIQKFELTFNLSDASKARIAEVEMADFGIANAQILSDSQARLFAIDFNGVFRVGSENVQVAVVTLETIKEGTTSLSLSGISVMDFGDNILPSTFTSGTLNIANAVPEVSFDGAQSVSIDVGATFEASGFASDPGDTSWTATVDYGDGSGSEPLEMNVNTFNLSHLYVGVGQHTITVRVSDDNGAVGVGTLSVTVLGDLPTLPDMPGPSQDLDGDGLAEDVNGNGRGDFADVVVLFDHLESPQVQQNRNIYDFNLNTKVDMADVIKLFEIILN